MQLNYSQTMEQNDIWDSPATPTIERASIMSASRSVKRRSPHRSACGFVYTIRFDATATCVSADGSTVFEEQVLAKVGISGERCDTRIASWMQTLHRMYVHWRYNESLLRGGSGSATPVSRRRRQRSGFIVNANDHPFPCLALPQANHFRGQPDVGGMSAYEKAKRDFFSGRIVEQGRSASSLSYEQVVGSMKDNPPWAWRGVAALVYCNANDERLSLAGTEQLMRQLLGVPVPSFVSNDITSLARGAEGQTEFILMPLTLFDMTRALFDEINKTHAHASDDERFSLFLESLADVRNSYRLVSNVSVYLTVKESGARFQWKAPMVLTRSSKPVPSPVGRILIENIDNLSGDNVHNVNREIEF